MLHFLVDYFKNPSRRIFWLVIVGFVSVCGYFTVWNYNRQCSQSEESVLLRLEGIANALALQIDAPIHQKIATTYSQKDAILFNTQDTFYYKLHHTLRRNAEANMLKTPAYTLVFDTLKQHFEFIATSADAPYFRHTYKSFHPTLKERYTEGGILPMYMDENGMWLSAFAPVRDVQGQTIAVVMVDENFTAFIARAKRGAWWNLMIALCIIAPIVVALIIWLQRLIFREAKFKARLEAAYDENVKISMALEQSYEQLSSLDKLRKEMIANISHDLRTPLTNLSGYIETLFIRRHDITLLEREKYLSIAIQESQRLRKLIDDLFELSKLEADQVEINAEPFPITELLQDVFVKYSVICEEKKIKISTNIVGNEPWVVADLKLIDRVLQNLLDNAIRYNLTENGTIDLSLQQIDNQLFIQISNSSETIPPSVLPHLFDRYFKVSSEEGSTGLGLAIVKKIIDLHATQITVTSEAGLTTFRFALPIFSPDAQAS